MKQIKEIEEGFVKFIIIAIICFMLIILCSCKRVKAPHILNGIEMCQTLGGGFDYLEVGNGLIWCKNGLSIDPMVYDENRK